MRGHFLPRGRGFVRDGGGEGLALEGGTLGAGGFFGDLASLRFRRGRGMETRTPKKPE